MAGKKRIEGTEAADLAAVYGIGILGPSPLPYEIWVRLYLALPRVGAQRSWEIRRGIEMAMSRGTIPAGYYEAIYSDPAVAAVARYKDASSRAEAAALAAFGF